MATQSRGRNGQFLNRNGSNWRQDLNHLTQMTEILTQNALLQRSELFKRHLDPRRDINDEVGYPETYDITIEDYKDLYERHGVASRVVDVLPDECWMVWPHIWETDNPEETTPFEEAIKQLDKQISPNSYYIGEEGSKINNYLHLADRLSGIGRFGIILLGLNDGASLEGPPAPNESMELTFLRVFDEGFVEIKEYERNPSSPRFGHPTLYEVQVDATRDYTKTRSVPVQTPTNKVTVHWQRVIHIPSTRWSSEVFGISRLQPTYDRLYDLQKLYAGSAEMYWRGAFPGIALESNPKLGANVRIDIDKTRDMLEKYMTGLQRYLALTGMSAKSLAPQVVDPRPQIEAQIDALCITIKVPKRIFMGSERGELASTQDDATFNDRLLARHNRVLTPQIVVPFYDRLIYLGVLPEPADGYQVEWPDLDALTDNEKAEIAEGRSRTMMNYVSGQVGQVITLPDFLVHELNFTPGQADAIIKKVQSGKWPVPRIESQMPEQFTSEDTSSKEDAEDNQDSTDSTTTDEGNVDASVPAT